MAESIVKIKASLNEMLKEVEKSESKYYYIKYYNGSKNYTGDDDKAIVFEALLRHNEIGNRSIERNSPYTFETLEKTFEKLVQEYQEEISNKNYMNEPIKNNKYYVSESDGYEIIKDVDNGYKVRGYFGEKLYVLTYGWQGYYYKDYEAFKTDDDVCYIPEYNNVAENKNCLLISERDKTDDKYYRKDIINEVKNELNSRTYQCFFNKKAPKKLIENIAEIVFDIIDWQHPSSYLYETDWDETIKEYFSNHSKDLEKYASEELKKELEEQEMVYG